MDNLSSKLFISWTINKTSLFLFITFLTYIETIPFAPHSYFECIKFPFTTPITFMIEAHINNYYVFFLVFRIYP